MGGSPRRANSGESVVRKSIDALSSKKHESHQTGRDHSWKIAGAHVVFYKMVCTRVDKKGGAADVQAVLLYKRTQDAPVHRGFWALFGGELKEQEHPKSVLRREVEEELDAGGLEKDLQGLSPLCFVNIPSKQEPRSIQYFTAPLNMEMDNLRLKRSREGKVEKVEGEGLGWFSEEEIHHLTIRPEDREALARFFGWTLP